MADKKSKFSLFPEATSLNDDDIFLINDGSGVHKVKKSTLVDSEISDTSTNAVENQAVKGYVDKVNKNTTYQLSKSSDGTKIVLEGSDGTKNEVSDNNTTYSAATSSTAGLMSASDKAKLDTVDKNANAYSLPTASATVLGGVKVGENLTISSGVLNAKDTTYEVATTEKDGLLSANDKAKLDSAFLSSSVESVVSNYFATKRTGKIYGVKIPVYASNTSTVCTKTDDNEGLVCEPSTDTVEGQDDYEDIPLFNWLRCNYIREDDGFAVPTALEGTNEYKTSGSVDVGNVYPSFYYSLTVSDDGSYLWLRVSDKKNAPAGIMQIFEPCIREDGTEEPYFVFSSFFSGKASDGYLRSQPDLPPERLQSYNNMVTNYSKKGAGYHGRTVTCQTFQHWMIALKYGQKSSQKVFVGVTSWNFQYALAEKSSEERTYVVVTSSQASNILVGGGVSVGYSGTTSANLDRGNTLMHAYADDVTVLSKMAQDDGNYRIYLDADPFITTLPDGADESKVDVYITSMHARAGWTDSVIGKHDGSPVSNTDGKHPYRVQGIEFAVGGYEVASDMFMNFQSDYSKDVYHCDKWLARTQNPTASTTGWTKIGNIPNSGTGGDWWIGDDSYVDGAWFPSAVGGSDSLGVGDRCYAGGTNTSGTREYLMGGLLWNGSGAGASFLLCGSALSSASWNFLSAD